MPFQTSVSEFPAIGYAGTVDSHSPHDYLTLKNVDTVAFPYGSAVVFKTSSPLTDLDVLFPATQSDKVAGIVAFAQTHARTFSDDAGNLIGDLSGVGLLPNTLFLAIRKGKALVKCSSGCKPGDYLFVRVAGTAADGSTISALENAASASNLIDCSKQGQWLTTATAGNLAWIDLDFTNHP